MRCKPFRILLFAWLPWAPALAEAAVPFPRAVEDIHVLRSYRAGKNSFVESSDRHAGAWTGKGYRSTLLDVKGTGSLRHIWSTWMKDGPYFEWQFFVDGEEQPGLRATLPDLVAAAEKLEDSPAVAGTVPLSPDKRDYNFYLPVPFQKSLRIDVVQQTDKVGLFFCQLDYRTGDESLRGVRLRSRAVDGQLKLEYEGWQPRPPRQIVTEPAPFKEKRIGPGEQVLVAEVTGPAIIRQLELNAPIDAPLRLLVRYDGAATAAVDVPVSRYFGSFQGASFDRKSENRAFSYLPMPFRRDCRIYLRNEGEQTVTARLELAVERVPAFDSQWGYFHALYAKARNTNGHHPLQVLYLRGRGHWLGMSLFQTGHDHGGGDFAVIDGESPAPAFLHGVNGEDYFTFAWFGRGQHQPYAQALTNETGRYRHHFENPYPFSRSFQLDWGAFPNLQPESVAVWYQDSPEDTTLRPEHGAASESFDVFGPAPIPLEVSARKGDLFGVLPSVGDLDAGKTFLARNEGEEFTSGWQHEVSAGPSLNLTYISRFGVRVNGEKFLGGNGHAFLARKRFTATAPRMVRAYFSFDDPIELVLNGRVLLAEKEQSRGFQTRSVELPVRAGENELVVRLTNYFNQTFNWTGFTLWLSDAAWDQL